MTQPSQEIGKRVVHSSAWLYGRRLVSSFFGLFVTALLARRLSPADFGLVALAGVTLKLVTSVGPVGVGSFIIYDREEGREERVHAAFWLNLVLTLLVTGIAFTLVPLVVRYYRMRELAPVLYFLLVQFAVSQFNGVPDALIQRALDFKKLVLRETILDLINGVAMVAMALTGYGVWSLLVPQFFITPIRVMIGFKLAGWRPTLPPRRPLWAPIFRYSLHASGSAFVNFLVNEGDTLTIGRRLGATDVGFYNRAWSSANIVGSNVTSVVANVSLPALSAVSSEKARLRAALNRMLRTLAMVSSPLLIGLLVVSDLFVITLYGLKWQPSVLPLQILIIYALRQTVGSPATVIFNVVGRPDVNFKLGLVFLPFYLASVIIGSSFGIVGVAAGVMLSRTSFGFVNFYFVARFTQQSLMEILTPLLRPVLASLLMGCVVFVLRLALPAASMPPWALLLVLSTAGALAWLLILRFLFSDLLAEMISIVDLLPIGLGRRVRTFLFVPGARVAT
jgi:PST family polysaccharide transporter